MPKLLLSSTCICECNVGILKVFSIPSVYLMNWKNSHILVDEITSHACSSQTGNPPSVLQGGVGWRAQVALVTTAGSFLNRLPLPLFPFLPEWSIFTIPLLSPSSLSLPLLLFSFHQLNKSCTNHLITNLPSAEKLNPPKCHVYALIPSEFDPDLLYFIDNFNGYYWVLFCPVITSCCFFHTSR